MSWSGAWARKGPERLVAVLRHWHETHGAELVGVPLGTILELDVSRPPRTLEDAWPLAVEHDLVAQGMLPVWGLTARQHCRVLVGRRQWSLHEKP